MSCPLFGSLHQIRRTEHHLRTKVGTHNKNRDASKGHITTDTFFGGGGGQKVRCGSATSLQPCLPSHMSPMVQCALNNVLSSLSPFLPGWGQNKAFLHQAASQALRDLFSVNWVDGSWGFWAAGGGGGDNGSGLLHRN